MMNTQNTLIYARAHTFMCLEGVSKVPSILMFSPLKAEVPFSKPVLRATVAVKKLK